MRINYLSLLDPFFYNGGGEKSGRSLLEMGVARGYEIKFSHVFPKLQIDMFESPDLFILTNLFNYGRSRRPWRFRRSFPTEILEEIITGGRYIHFDNAYCDVCDQNYLPCNGQEEGDQCPWKSGPIKWLTGSTCLKIRTARIYRNSVLNVFVSPLHRRIVQDMLGEEVVGSYYENLNRIDSNLFRNQGFKLETGAGSYYEHLDHIDLKLFKNRKKKRDIPFLFVGALHEAKGLEIMRERFANQDIVLVGSSPGGKHPGFGRWLGPLPYTEVAILMNRAQHFVFLPRWPEPFGRVVAEAALCGCELITNDNVGALSFGLDLSQPEVFQDAGTAFWETIDHL